jgi:hypothetical protein
MSSAAAAGAGSLRPSACSGARAGAGAGEKAALPPAPPKRSRSVGVPGFFCEKGGGAFSRSPSSHGLIKVVACRVEDAGESCVDGGPTAGVTVRGSGWRAVPGAAAAPRATPLFISTAPPPNTHQTVSLEHAARRAAAAAPRRAQSALAASAAAAGGGLAGARRGRARRLAGFVWQRCKSHLAKLVQALAPGGDQR